MRGRRPWKISSIYLHSNSLSFQSLVFDSMFGDLPVAIDISSDQTISRPCPPGLEQAELRGAVALSALSSPEICKVFAIPSRQ